MNQPIIEVHDLTLRAGKELILNQVSFAIQKGEAVALVGSNGAGKTSVLRCMLGIAQGTGEIRINGISLKENPCEAKRLIGYMPQAAAFCEATVKESLDFVAALREVPRKETMPLLDLVGLANDIKRPVRVLSTGMRQRLSLAMALVGRPPILVLDEPTASLDIMGQKEILQLLQELHSEGQTILLCSHRAEEVSALVERIIVMDQGNILASGPFHQIAPQLWNATEPIARFRKLNVS